MAKMHGGWRVSIGVCVLAGALAVPLAPDAAAEPAVGSVVINEVHYHPATDNEEFVELVNPGGTSVDLSGACFTAGISGCFPAGTVLPAGGFVVAAQQLAGYQAAFPAAPVPALVYGGSLSNSGETVTVSAAPAPPEPAVPLDTVAYTDAPPWPAAPDGDGPSLELADPLGDNLPSGAWRASDPAPTPGAVNSQYGAGPGPVIASIAPEPAAAGDPLEFTAAIEHATSASVEVTVGFAAPTVAPLVDDGAHGDGAAGDGLYGATVPGQPAGTLVRYRALAANAAGSAALPAEGSARPRLGFVVARPPVGSTIPVIDWYVKPSDYQQLLDHPLENTYVPAVVAVDGEVWDGAEVRVNGHARQAVKYSFKFKMPKGSPLDAGFLASPVDEFVIDGDLYDSSGVVAPLTSSVYADTNPLIAQMAKVHVEQNGSSFGLFTFAEEYDKLWRDRNGLDGAGDQQFQPEDVVGVFSDDKSAAAVGDRFEKVAPDDGDYTEVYALIRAIDSAPTPARVAALRDHFDVPALIEFLAVGAIVEHWDTMVHNYQLVRDGSTGRWKLVATDYDLTLTRQANDVLPHGPENLISAVRSDPVLSDLYLRRLRTLADKYFTGGVLKQRLNTMSAAVASEQAADLVRWPRGLESPAAGKARLQRYLDARQKELLTTNRTADGVPAAATPGLPVSIAAARYQGEGGDARDWVRLANPSPTEAVDLSGWRLEGAGTSTLPPGTVIPATGEITVPASAPASAVDRLPGSLVAGALTAGLDDAGGELRVIDAAGTVRGSAVLSTLSPPDPVADTGLTVEASADQVETIAPGGRGVKLTVTVTNHGPGPASAVSLTGAGTTCGRSLGTIPASRTTLIRCTTTTATGPDRTLRFRAATGSKTTASNRVSIRTVDVHTSHWWQTLPNAPRVGTIALGDASTLRAPVSLAAPTAPAVAGQPPVRWLVASAFEANRAVATQGAVLSPGSAVSIPLTDGVPVRVALASRNGAGTGARSPLTPFITPRASTNWPFASASAQVEQIFHDVDGRAPTSDERTWVLAALASTDTPAHVINARLGTGRWPTEIEPLVRLYTAYLGRPPDKAGLAFWLAQRAKGRTLASISSSFAASAEFVRKTGSLNNTAFVRFVYTSVLGRQAEANGLAFWTNRMAAGTTRGSVMTSFSESNEGRTRLAPRTKPTLAWMALTGRPPTAAEAQPATDWMNAGGSFETVIDGVRSSSVYGDRFS